MKLFCYALVFACLLIPVGTSARTGLVCIALLALLMLREVKRKVLYLGALALVGAAAIPFLPSAFSERMGTIKTYQADTSASTRIEVWKWTWAYVKDHPFGGGFEMYRQNSIRYETVKSVPTATGTSIERAVVVDKARAFHSSYFEVLGEEGWPGFILWLTINLVGIVRMEVLRRRYRKAGEDMAWVPPLAGALAYAQLIYLVGGAFVGIAFQSFIYMLLGAQIGLDTYLARKAERGGVEADGLAQSAAGGGLVPLPLAGGVRGGRVGKCRSLVQRPSPDPVPSRPYPRAGARPRGALSTRNSQTGGEQKGHASAISSASALSSSRLKAGMSAGVRLVMRLPSTTTSSSTTSAPAFSRSVRIEG